MRGEEDYDDHKEGSNYNVVQTQGRSNQSLTPQYQTMVDAFLENKEAHNDLVGYLKDRYIPKEVDNDLKSIYLNAKQNGLE